MHSVRVFQLARDLGVESADVIERLKKLGGDAKTASSSVDEDLADKVKRAFKIDALTAKKKRIYGSDEDEAEREQEKEALAAKIAAERAARDQAAAEAKAAAEERKANKGKRPTKAEKDAADKKAAASAVPPALQHAPGAPRLGRKVPLPPVELPEEDEDAADSVEEAPAAPAPHSVSPPPPAIRPTPPPASPVAPVVRTTIAPRVGPV